MAATMRGIKTQIVDGETGYLVDSSAECAMRIIELINSPKLISQIGSAAKESVREHFLMPRLALDYLQAIKGKSEQTGQSAGEGASLRP